MQAGRLRHVIEIQEVTEGKSASGAITESWAAFLSDVRASAEPITGRESFSSSQTYSEYEIKFTIRYRAGITAKMRILYDGDYYDIAPPINHMGRSRMLTIMGRRYND